MIWNTPDRTDSPDGFRFLPVPWWMHVLHPFNARKKYADIAYIAYLIRECPQMIKLASRRMTNLGIRAYPLYWLLTGIKTLGKRLLGVGIILALLGVPGIIGYLIGIAQHIVIRVH